MEGWICLHRKLLNWQWYSDKNVRLVFIHLLLKANHKKTRWQNVDIDRGQLVSSYANLALEIGITVQQLRTALDKLKASGEITTKTTNKYTFINIVNYSVYQDNQDEINKQNNKQIPNKQQTNNKQITTNNNDNNVTMKQYKKENIKEKYFENEKLNKSFDEWLEYKKQRKEKYTDIGLKKLITQINNQLKKHTVDEIVNLIDTCMERNYKGIIFDMLPKKMNDSIPDWVNDWVNGKE